MQRSWLEEKIIEVQRKGANGVWSDANLKEDDGPAFFESRSGRAMALDALPLPVGWEWTTNWKISTHEPDCDAEGWVRDSRDANVRRRWWKRRRDALAPSSQANSQSSYAMSSSRPGAKPGASAGAMRSSSSDPAELATHALQRLDAAVQRIPTVRCRF